MKKLIILGLLTTLFLAGCSELKSEKERYVAANIESACMLFDNPDGDFEVLSNNTRDIFKKHGFPVKDDEAMKALTEKYTTDPEVQDEVQAALKECAAELFQNIEENGEATESSEESAPTETP